MARRNRGGSPLDDFFAFLLLFPWWVTLILGGSLWVYLNSLSIGTPEQIFHLLYGCQQIDLSTATFCQFAFNHAYFAYPKPNRSRLLTRGHDH